MPNSNQPAAGDATGSTTTERRRLVFIDSCRGICAAIIAAHHLCLYGPLPEAVESLAGQSGSILPAVGEVVAFLREHARYAVQVFLVLGGFVQYLTFRKGEASAGQGIQLLGQRFLRLALPVWGVLAIGLLVHFVSLPWEPITPFIDPFPGTQLMAEIFFLQDILGYGSLMPGHWYPCIDFQFGVLFVAMSLLISAIQRWFQFSAVFGERLFLATFGALAILSLYWWNCDSSFDPWVIYYLGSYFLGVLTAAVVQRKVSPLLFVGFTLIMVCSLTFDFRIRLVVALAMSCILLTAGMTQNLDRWLNFRWLTWMGRISYSFFLTHCIVHWVVLSIGHALTGTEPLAALGWMLLAYAVSIPAGWAFYQTVERPAMSLVNWLRVAGQVTAIRPQTVAT